MIRSGWAMSIRPLWLSERWPVVTTRTFSRLTVFECICKSLSVLTQSFTATKAHPLQITLNMPLMNFQFSNIFTIHSVIKHTQNYSFQTSDQIPHPNCIKYKIIVCSVVVSKMFQLFFSRLFPVAAKHFAKIAVFTFRHVKWIAAGI